LPHAIRSSDDRLGAAAVTIHVVHDSRQMMLRIDMNSFGLSEWRGERDYTIESKAIHM
jgi:hypothetical protein